MITDTKMSAEEMVVLTKKHSFFSWWCSHRCSPSPWRVPMESTSGTPTASATRI